MEEWRKSQPPYQTMFSLCCQQVISLYNSQRPVNQSSVESICHFLTLTVYKNHTSVGVLDFQNLAPVDLAWWIDGFMTTVITVITILLNTVSIVIFTSSSLRSPTNTILALISALDVLTCVLRAPLLIYVYLHRGYHHLPTMAWCTEYNFVHNFIPSALHSTAFLLNMGLSVQRFVGVGDIRRLRPICSYKGTISIAVASFCVSALIHSLYPITYKITPVVALGKQMLASGKLEEVETCQVSARYPEKLENLSTSYAWARISALQLLPGIVMCVCNISLITISYKTYNYRRRLIGAIGTIMSVNRGFEPDEGGGKELKHDLEQKRGSISTRGNGTTRADQEFQFSMKSETEKPEPCERDEGDVCLSGILEDRLPVMRKVDTESLSTSENYFESRGKGEGGDDDVDDDNDEGDGKNEEEDENCHRSLEMRVDGEDGNGSPAWRVLERNVTRDLDRILDESGKIYDYSDRILDGESHRILDGSDKLIDASDRKLDEESDKAAKGDVVQENDRDDDVVGGVSMFKAGCRDIVSLDTTVSTQVNKNERHSSNENEAEYRRGSVNTDSNKLKRLDIETLKTDAMIFKNKIFQDIVTKDDRVLLEAPGLKPSHSSMQCGNPELLSANTGSESVSCDNESPSSSCTSPGNNAPSCESDFSIHSKASRESQNEFSSLVDSKSPGKDHQDASLLSTIIPQERKGSDISSIISSTIVEDTIISETLSDNNNTKTWKERNKSKFSPKRRAGGGRGGGGDGSVAELRPTIMLVLVTSCTLFAELMVTVAIFINFMNQVVNRHFVKEDTLITFILVSNLITMVSFPINFVFFAGLSRPFRNTLVAYAHFVLRTIYRKGK